MSRLDLKFRMDPVDSTEFIRSIRPRRMDLDELDPVDLTEFLIFSRYIVFIRKHVDFKNPIHPTSSNGSGFDRILKKFSITLNFIDNTINFSVFLKSDKLTSHTVHERGKSMSHSTDKAKTLDAVLFIISSKTVCRLPTKQQILIKFMRKV